MTLSSSSSCCHLFVTTQVLFSQGFLVLGDGNDGFLLSGNELDKRKKEKHEQYTVNMKSGKQSFSSRQLGYVNQNNEIHGDALSENSHYIIIVITLKNGQKAW